MRPDVSRTGLLAPVYDRLLARSERGRLGRWRRLVWDAVEGRKGLEIGVGTGANFAYYPAASDVVGIDVSPRMLRQAASKSDRGNTPILAADVQALPFRDDAFDWVAATLVFCEVPDPVAGLREVRRVLRPGGILVLLEHVRPSGWAGRVADVASALSVPLWGEHFNRPTVSYLPEAGFSVQATRYLWRDVVVHLVAGDHHPRQSSEEE